MEPDLNELAERYLEIESEIEELKEELQEIKDIFEEVLEPGDFTFTRSGIKIAYEEYQARRFHPSLLREKYLPIYNEFNLLKTYFRIVIDDYRDPLQ